MSTFIVETGTAVTDSNTYVSLASVSAWCSERHLTEWASASTSEQESALYNAMDYVESHEYKGGKVYTHQSLRWPRNWVYEEDGVLLDWTEIPKRLKDAVCYAAYEEVKSPGCLIANLNQSNYLKKKKIDILEWEYFESKIVPGTVFSKVEEFLRPLVKITKDAKDKCVSVVRV